LPQLNLFEPQANKPDSVDIQVNLVDSRIRLVGI